MIGGGLVEAADLLLPPVRVHFGTLVMAGDQRPPVPIVAAHLGEHAGAIGAALLLRRSVTDLLVALAARFDLGDRGGGPLPAAHVGVLAGLERLVDVEEVADLVREVIG